VHEWNCLRIITKICWNPRGCAIFLKWVTENTWGLMGDGKATWCFAKWCMVIAWKLIWCSHDEENDNWMVHDVWVTVNDNFYKIYDKRWMIAKMTHINKIMLAHPIDQSEWFKLHRLHPNVVYVNHLQWCNEGANEKCNELNIVANSWFKSKGKKNDWGKRECDEWKEILNILYLYFFCLDLFCVGTSGHPGW